MAAGLPFSLGVPKGWFRMPEPDVEGGGTAWAEDIAASVSAARGFGGAEAERLRRSLTAAVARAAAQQRPGRVRLVYLGSPEQPVVRAWAALELYSAPGQTPESHAAALSAAEGAAEVLVTTLAAHPAVTLHDFPVAPRPREQAGAGETRATLAGTASADAGAGGAGHAATDVSGAGQAGTEEGGSAAAGAALDGAAGAGADRDAAEAEAGVRDARPRPLQDRFVVALFVPGERILQLQISTPDLTAFADLPAVGRAMADSIVLGDPAAESAGAATGGGAS